MLAKVSQNYFGIFGLYDEEKHSSVPKTRDSAPFEINSALFSKLKKKGVLVEAQEEEISEEIEEETSEETEEASEEKETFEDPDLTELTLADLKEKAKEYGISFKVGMSKADLIDLIKAAETEEAPELTAEEPE